MAQVSVIKGAVSRVSKAPIVVGSGGNVSGGLITSFLIGTTPAQMYGLSMLNDGDQVEAAGTMKDGVMHAITLRNNTTGVVHSQNSTKNANLLRWAVLGLFLYSIWAGGAVFILMLPLLIFAAWFVLRSTSPIKKANKLLGV